VKSSPSATDYRQGKWPRRTRSLTLSLLLAALVGWSMCGCASGNGSDAVFSVGTNFSGVFPARTHELLDIGLPGLHNLSAHPVTITAVTFAGDNSSLQIVNVTAYNYRQVGNGVISQTGDLPKEYAKYVPHPLSDAVTGPHADSAWFVVIAFRVSKPGTFELPKVRIDYTTNGHAGWQYQTLATEMKISS
jgi:hypothetical protein